MGVVVYSTSARPASRRIRNSKGKVRAVVRLPQDVVNNYGGGFIGLLRPELYERLLAALPTGALQVNREVTQHSPRTRPGVTLQLRRRHGGETYDVLVGADGIDSLVRRTLRGVEQNREHNLHIFGGFTFDDTLDVAPGQCIVSHNRTTQGSWTAIRHKGRSGFQWWVLTAHDAAKDFPATNHGGRHGTCRALGSRPLPATRRANSPRADPPAWGHPRPGSP